ncbi:MAG: hypothetical protein LBS96_10390 [Oscillospiraceae bacterium]|jgi:hypothetical protein|nr:hypothetical protein [Oscillospiraceae bacterium]
MTKQKRQANRFYLFYTFALWLVHLLLPLHWSDDAIFFAKAAELALPDFLRSSSRVPVDALTYLFALHPLAWRLLNPLALLGFSVLLAALLHLESRREKAALALLCLYPSMFLAEAGFMATSLNYLWPAFCGAFALWALRAFDPADCARRWLPLASLLPVLYAVNMQQLVVVLVPLLLLLWLRGVARFQMRRQKAAYALAVLAHVALALGGAGFVFWRSLTGENARMAREAARYFPDFAALSLLQKAELGISSTFQGLAASLSLPAAAFLAFCVYLFFAVRRSALPKWRQWLALVPALLVVALVLATLCGAAPGLHLVNYKMQKAAYHSAFAADALFCLLLGLVAFTLHGLLQTRPARLQALLALALGLASRCMMGFSPTVWASGYRTFFLLLLALLLCVFLVQREAVNTARKPSPKP